MHLCYNNWPITNGLRTLFFTLVLMLIPIGAWGQEWTQVSTADALQGIFNTGGNAKLTANITGCFTVAAENVNLDLNRYKIDGNSQGTVIIISSGATLTILDSSTEKDGKITGGANSTTAGTGYPGNINCGGGVRNNGTFYFQSGKITGNSARDGAGVFNNGTMVMSGGEISGNTCDYSGYGIFNNWGASLTITAGSVINNTGGYNLSSVVGGGILNRGASLTLSGNPVIKNNTGSGNPSNIYLLNNYSTITIGGLTGNDGDIGIMMQTPGVFTSGLNSDTGYKKFTSDHGDYEPCFGGTDNKEATLLRNWLSLKNRMEAGGTIVLNKDYTATTSDACLTVPSEKSVTLDLNSYTIHRNLTSATTDGCVIKNQGTLTLNGSGVIRGGNNTGDGGGINNTGALTIDGNIRICLNSCNGNGDGIYNNGSLTLAKNPEVINNRSETYNRQNIYLASGKKINISGTLTGSAGRIGVTMQTPGVFTTGLSSNEASFFVSDNSGLKLYKNTTLNESVIGTYWSHLQYQIDTAQDNPAEATVITLETNKAYEALSTESYLHIPASKKISIVKNGVNYINRNSSTAREEGYVIKNEGELSINGCYISGGYNHGDGGGIYNTGKLELKGHAWIWKCRATGNGGAIYNSTTGEVVLSQCTFGREYNENEAEKGGGIYNDGTLKHENDVYFQYNRASINGGAIYQNGTLEIKGETRFSYNYNSTIYLPTNKVIKVTGQLTNDTYNPIRVSMETLGVFTEGLNSYGTVSNFAADAGSSVIKISLNGSEAMMGTYWSELQQEITNANTTPTTITLNQSYYGYISDTPLTIGNGQDITIVMTNHTINRNLSGNFKYNGNVFHVENGGKLTIQGYGTITGGCNTENGGGILNEGSLTLNGNDAANGAIDIGSNKVVSGKSGAGIYLANTGSLTIQGYVYVSGNYIGSEYTTRSDIYIPSGQTITTSSINVNSKIGITHAESHAVFTQGLSWSSLVNIPFYANDSEHYKVGRTSNGEAVIGPYYNITNHSVDHGSVSVNTKAVEGEVVSITPASNEGYVPMSLSYTPTGGSGETVITTYPENATHTFTMPAQNITINAEFKPGGFCGDTGNESKVKYYLPAENGTLTFVAKDDGNDHAMASTYVSADDVPWKNMSYSSVSLSDHVSSISPYAFFGSSISSITIPGSVTTIGTLALGNCQNLSTINVTGGTSFSVDGNVLYNNGKTRLLCFPAGLNATSYTLPSTVETIDNGAFAYNPRLTTINVGGGSHFKAENGVLFNNEGTSLIYYPARKEGDVYDVASTVTEIKPYAFHNNNLLKAVNFCETTVPTGGTEMFGGSNTAKIMVKKGLKAGNDANHYQGVAYWSNYYSRIYEMDLANAIINLEYDNYVYETFDNPVVKPGVTSVKLTTGNYTQTLRSGIDYVAINDGSYSNNNVVGTATVTITGAGGYDGTSSTKIFTIKRQLIISGASDYYSYYAKENLFAPEGIGTVYTVSGVNWSTGVVTVTNSGLGYLPENVPVLIYKHTFVSGTMNDTYQLTAHAAGTPPTPCEYFKAETEDKTLDGLKALRSASEIYVLRGNNFVRATSGTLPARHCYIFKPTGTGAPPAVLVINNEDGNGTTNIGSIENESLEIENEKIYDLSGRQVKAPGKGVYIINGKKIMIK